MLLQDKKIAIIGGGPGGLTLARLLQLKGVEVKVYERDLNKDVRVQGATLDLHYESGLKAIEAAGLMDAFKEAYRPGADLGRVIDKHGNIIYDEHDKEASKDLGNEFFRPEIDRSDLRDVLLNSLDPNTVVWDSHLVAISQNEVWELQFKNGTTATADIIIGADGANSKIRPFVTQAKPTYAGTTIVQGNVKDAATTIAGMHGLLKGGKVYTHSDGKAFHVSAKGDGSIDFYVSSKTDENLAKSSGVEFDDRTQLLTWATKEFAGWDKVWLQLFENVSLPLLIRPQYCMPLDQTWEAKPNITLLGDAAHIMPPSGEGVNLAMLDALELSENLTSSDFKDIQSAIAAYEQPMLKRAVAEAHDSMDMVQWMHADGANEQLINMFNHVPGE